jgi:predicted 2-oxoglutarate/Fe(II)-dependent dioxygenase YbiX
MEPIKIDRPIVIDHFLTKESLQLLSQIFKAKQKLASPGVVGNKLDNSFLAMETKKNRVYLLQDELLKNISQEIKNRIFSILKEQGIPFPKNLSLSEPQLSYYREGDFYRPHTDVSPMGITLVIMPGKKDFEGGELQFHLKKKIKIPYVTNRAVLFSSNTVHEVLKIKSEGLRISLQFFFRTKSAKSQNLKSMRENRKELEQDLITLASSEIEDPIAFMKAKSHVKSFVDKTLLGSYRFIHYSLTRKFDHETIIEYRWKPYLQIEITSKSNLQLSVCVKGKKVWTEVHYKKVKYRFPFRLFTWEMVKKMHARLNTSP